jgi:CRP/FNR family transcriptional regulator
MESGTPGSATLFDALPPKVRAEAIANAKHRRYEAGDVLVQEGDSALYLYVVESGHARIERAGAGVVGRFGPGDFFGELALLDRTDRTATVIADDDLSCYLISAWEFKALLESYPAMAIPMLHKLIERLHRR